MPNNLMNRGLKGGRKKLAGIPESLVAARLSSPVMRVVSPRMYTRWCYFISIHCAGKYEKDRLSLYL